MPRTHIVFYRDANGTVPVLEWLQVLRGTNPLAYRKCIAALLLLREEGHELRRPQSDTLRDGIRELRIRAGHVHYRLLYAIQGRVTAIVAHAVTKEGRVPPRDIDLAVVRVTVFLHNPVQHTYTWESSPDANETRENH